MLERFFISKVRVKILRLFLEEQHSAYHVRDIVRKTQEEINAVRRELINLENAGLFSKEAKFNRLYYSLNADYPLYDELRAMIYKEYGLGGSLLKEKDNLGSISYAVIGSLYLRNDPMNPNELDLLVIGSGIQMERLGILVKTIELDKQREINYTVLTDEQFEAQKKHMESYLNSFIAKKKLFIIGSEDSFLS